MTKRSAGPIKRPTAVDLFCGVGGMSLGFEQAGFDVVLGVDVDGHHIAAHARNFPHSVALRRSIVELDAADVYAALGGKLAIDLVFGGPPCQGFSHMGLRDSEDPRNSLVDEFARLVAELQPKVFVMENVPGLISGKTRPVLDRTVAYLKRNGYRVVEPARVLDASQFGVPQKRKRLFLLGWREDLSVHLAYPMGPSPGQPPRPTVWEAIGDLPSVEAYDRLFLRDVVDYDKLPTSDYARVARGIVNDPSDFCHPREWAAFRCTSCLRVKHSDRAADVYAATPPGQMVPGHKLPRLDPNGIAPTLRAGSDSTHGSYTAPRPVHPYQPRCITAREAARLHGFPDWFGFYPLKWHAYRQIGNSVCPPVARAVGREILSALGIIPVKPKEFVQLYDSFLLPEDRPRTKKRIPHLVHYPPVVKNLFDRAYDDITGKLRRASFTFLDVQRAIQTTGVNLSWTRADTFVPEIARSRNVLQIIQPCLAKGYSIRAIAEGDNIGEFVPVGEPGTVDDKEVIHIRSRDLADTLVLEASTAVNPEDYETLPLLLTERRIVESLWGGRKVAVDLLLPANGNASGLPARYRLVNGRGVAGRGGLVVSAPGNLPTRARIARLAQSIEADELVVFVPITSRHVLVNRFENCLLNPNEVYRQVYEILLRAPGRKEN